MQGGGDQVGAASRPRTWFAAKSSAATDGRQRMRFPGGLSARRPEVIVAHSVAIGRLSSRLCIAAGAEEEAEAEMAEMSEGDGSPDRNRESDANGTVRPSIAVVTPLPTVEMKLKRTQETGAGKEVFEALDLDPGEHARSQLDSTPQFLSEHLIDEGEPSVSALEPFMGIAFATATLEVACVHEGGRGLPDRRGTERA
jgi:hypothetical protein